MHQCRQRTAHGAVAVALACGLAAPLPLGAQSLRPASRMGAMTTEDSVRALKRRYGYRADHWHATVPEGKLWDAVRDYEDARRLQAALHRRSRVR